MSVLEPLGIDSEAETVYRALLSLPASDASHVARECPDGVAVEEALARLVELGLVSRSSDDPATYSPVDPATGFGDLLSAREAQVKAARLVEGELQRIYQRSRAHRDPSNLIEILSGRDEIVARAYAFERSCEHEIRALDLPPYHGSITSNPDEEDFIARGGVVRVIYSTEALNVPDRLDAIDNWITSGEQARVRHSLPMKLTIFDDDCAMLPLRTATSTTPSPTFIVVRPSSLLDALISHFEFLWDSSIPVDSVGINSDESHPADGQANHLISLLIAGLPDETIARRIGISPRTMHRRLHTLMDEHGCATRFQLALQLIRSGAIRP